MKYNIVIAPGPNEVEEAKKYKVNIILNNSKPINIIELISLIKNSSYVISNDTGPGHIAALSKVNTLWLALDNSVTKANLSYRENSHMLLKEKMEDLSVKEVKDCIIKNKLLDKVE